SHRVADMVMGALASIWPNSVMACSQGTSAILTLGGVDPRSGRRYVSYETVKGGFGARPNKDGINCIASGISNTMNTPVEVLELAFPVRIERYEVNPDSGGFGHVAERDPAAIGRDLLDGYVSPAAAERDYGIADAQALRNAAAAEDAS